MLLEMAAKEKVPFAYKEGIKSFESQPDSFTLCGVTYVKEELFTITSDNESDKWSKI